MDQLAARLQALQSLERRSEPWRKPAETGHRRPEPFFWIHPDTGRLQPHPRLDVAQVDRAIQTIAICNLQRPALCTKRAEMLGRVGRWLELLQSGAGGSRALNEEWELLSAPTTEYKFVIRHVLKLKGHHSLSARDKELFETQSAANAAP